jgi:uncharacterized protein YhfF
MLLTENYDKFFLKIKNDMIKNAGKCLIFVSTNTDALCSCRILTVTKKTFFKIPKDLLKDEGVSHQIVPICNYEDLEKSSIHVEKEV